MKNYFLTAIVCLCCSPIFAQDSPEETEVLKLNEAFEEAMKNADTDFYKRILADDYVSYGTDGSLKNKSQVLKEVQEQKENPSYRITEIGSEDVKVKLSGDLAVVTAKWTATTQAMDDDEPHDDLGHYIAVFEKRDGSWKLISEMGSEKPHTPEELEPSLKKTSDMYDEAMKNQDKEAFKKLLAEDYQSTNPYGEVRTAAEEMENMFHPDVKMESSSAGDKKFKIYGNFAVETGKYDAKGTYKGEPFTESGRYTSSWIYKDGKWKMIADHTSKIQSED